MKKMIKDAGLSEDLHVELKDRFRAASAFLSQPPPAGISQPKHLAHRQSLRWHR